MCKNFGHRLCGQWISPVECQNQDMLNTGKIKRKRSDINQKPFTPRILRTTTQVDAPVEVQGMETGIEFFLLLVAME